jgi:hypothetical protein
MGTRYAVLLAAALGGVVCLGVFAMPVREAAESRGEAPPAGSAADARIPMAEIRLERKVVVGRIVHEDDEMIRVEPIGMGAIGYRKDTLQELRRFSLSPSAFAERAGDYCLEQAPGSNDALAEFAKASAAYQKALILTQDPDDVERLNRKLAAVTAGRQDWHDAEMQRQEVTRAQAETELLEVEKQLAAGKLAMLEQQERALQQLGQVVTQIDQQVKFLTAAVDQMNRHVTALAGQVEEMRNDALDLDRNADFRDLRASVNRLRRDVDYLLRSRGGVRN